MYRVSVLYPATEGASFDHEYYKTKHIPLIQSKMGDVIKGVEIDKAVGDGMGGAAPFVAAVHFKMETAEAFGQALMPHAAEIMGDVGNYTTIQPVLVVSEIVEG